MKYIIIGIFILGAAAVLFAGYKSGHLVKNIFTAAFQGLASLFAVNVLGLLTGVTLAVNWYTIVTVSLFGLPSAITLLLLDTFLR